MSALQGKQEATDALRRKQLIVSFVEQFKLQLENTRFIDFQFHIAKLTPVEVFYAFSLLCRPMHRVFYKEAVVSFFLRVLQSKYFAHRFSSSKSKEPREFFHTHYLLDNAI